MNVEGPVDFERDAEEVGNLLGSAGEGIGLLADLELVELTIVSDDVALEVLVFGVGMLATPARDELDRLHGDDPAAQAREPSGGVGEHRLRREWLSERGLRPSSLLGLASPLLVQRKTGDADDDHTGDAESDDVHARRYQRPTRALSRVAAPRATLRS